MGHGIESQGLAQRTIGRPVEVEDGRAEEGEVEDVAEDVLDVAKVNGEGRQEEAEAEGEDVLDEDGEGE